LALLLDQTDAGLYPLPEPGYRAQKLTRVIGF
jgi:hypothetical protein